MLADDLIACGIAAEVEPGEMFGGHSVLSVSFDDFIEQKGVKDEQT